MHVSTTDGCKGIQLWDVLKSHKRLPYETEKNFRYFNWGANAPLVFVSQISLLLPIELLQP